MAFDFIKNKWEEFKIKRRAEKDLRNITKEAKEVGRREALESFKTELSERERDLYLTEKMKAELETKNKLSNLDTRSPGEKVWERLKTTGSTLASKSKQIVPQAVRDTKSIGSGLVQEISPSRKQTPTSFGRAPPIYAQRPSTVLNQIPRPLFTGGFQRPTFGGVPQVDNYRGGNRNFNVPRMNEQSQITPPIPRRTFNVPQVRKL